MNVARVKGIFIYIFATGLPFMLWVSNLSKKVANGLIFCPTLASSSADM
jgi:hypothetical protein